MTTELAVQESKPVIIQMAGGVFASGDAFEMGQRMARGLATSDLVPQAYKGNVANCMIALDIAMRMKLPPIMVLQGLNVIHGRPAWSAQFIISAINASGLFSPLRFEFDGAENTDAWRCRATAIDKSNDAKLEGPWVSIEMSRKEGWYDRNGSKWRTMPQAMLMYRAGAFFGRLYAGHILTGMTLTTEEVIDSEPIDVTPPAQPAAGATPAQADAQTEAQELEARAAKARRGRKRGTGSQDEPVQESGTDAAVDQATGEILAAPADKAPLARETVPEFF